MATTVINIKDAPEGWEHLAKYRYIGRAGKGQSGTYGNPFVLRTESPDSRAYILKQYREWFYKPENAELRDEVVKELQGKILVCFCRPKLCHGDVIAEYVDTLHFGM